MDSQKQIPELLKPIMAKHVKNINDYSYYAWPFMFGSTAGPRGGIGGCAMTMFTIEAYNYEFEDIVIYLSAGMISVKKGKLELFKDPGNWERIKLNEQNKISG